MLASQKEELNHLLGKDVRSSIEVMAVDNPGATVLDLPLAQSKALSGRAEMRQAAFQIRQIDLERKSKKLEYLPDLSLVLDYFSVYGTQVIPKNVVALGLFLNWQPLDWGRRKFEIATQRKLITQAHNATREQEAQIIMEVNSAHRRLEESQEYVNVTSLGRSLCLERLRVVTAINTRSRLFCLRTSCRCSAIFLRPTINTPRHCLRSGVRVPIMQRL